MNKLKQIFIILCILLLALVLVACTGDTPKPSDEGGETEQPGGDTPGTDDPAIPADGVFTITQDRFAAEKAALAMFDAVSGRMQTGEVAPSEDGNVNIEFTSYEDMIGAGSYLKMTPDGENGYKIESFAVYKEENAPVVYAVMEGNIAKIDFSGFSVSLFALADENGNPIENATWDEMPAVFLVNNRRASVTDMINSFVSGWNPSSSARGRNLKPVYEGTQSFYNPQDGKGWIVYTDSMDGSTHKVNFNSNDTAAFTLDGWCEVQAGYNATVSETPAVKSEEPGMLSDEEALKLGTDAYAYYYSTNLLFAGSNNKPEWLDFDMSVEGVMKVIIMEHSEPDFFGEPVSVEGEMNIDKSSAKTLYTLTVDGRKIEFTAAGDPNGSSIAGDIRSFSIDGKNYSHLRDELYLSCIRIFTSTSNIVSLFNAIKDEQGIDYWWKGVDISTDGSTYTFKDSTPADWLLGYNESGIMNRLNGKIVIDGDSFTVDMVFEEISTSDSDSTVLTTTEVSAEGTLTEDTKRPQFTSLKYLNHGLECNANELRIINLISSDLDTIIVNM